MSEVQNSRMSVRGDGIESRTGAPEYFFCTKCGTQGTEQKCKCGYLALGPFPNWKARAEKAEREAGAAELHAIQALARAEKAEAHLEAVRSWAENNSGIPMWDALSYERDRAIAECASHVLSLLPEEEGE